MSVGLQIGPIQGVVDGMNLLFPVVSSWLEIESDATTGFRDPGQVEKLLDEIRSRLLASVMGEKVAGATMDCSRFTQEIREFVRAARYRRPDGVDRRSVRSLKSSRRLSMIWNLHVSQARGYARWISDITPDGLANEPCYELIRVRQSAEIRDWPQVWWQQGGSFYGAPGKDYPLAKGRMIAKKTDPIWRWISRFHTPWPPYDWGDGMGLRGISVYDAESMGVIAAGGDSQKADTKFSLSAPLNEADSFSAFVGWLDENMLQ